MLSLIWTIPLWPLLGFLLNGFFGRRWSAATAGVVACASVFVSCVLSVGGFAALLSYPGRQFFVAPFEWIVVNDFHVPFGFLFDPLSAVMVLVVTGVSFLIHVYSTAYMAHDPDQSRYFSYLNLFVVFMLILVLADNFLVLYVGWEGVGLCSYLLIGFWFRRPAAAKAGMKAFIVNRVGDLGFALAIFLIYRELGTVNFIEVFDRAGVAAGAMGGTLTAIGLLLFAGATGKSAQIPLYVWLPDAMEGPTPVSALIHAATMVTAGVYMVARCAPLFVLTPVTLHVIAIVAFFKALLFLGAGSVIHAMGNEQDLTKMGGLKRFLPITYWTFLIAALAIAGIPPLAGFVSKDEILWQSLTSPLGHWGLWLFGAITALLTAFYMFRLVFLAFHGQPRFGPDLHPHESPRAMTIPLVCLGVLSIVGGWIGWPLILGGGSWFAQFLSPVFAGFEVAPEIGASSHFFELGMMVLSVAVALVGIAWAYRWYVRSPARAESRKSRFAVVYRLLVNKYWVDEIYDALIIRPLVGAARMIYRRFDLGIIDGAANGLAAGAQKAAAGGVRLSRGRFRWGAIAFSVGCVVVLGWAILAFVRGI
ncbi:MAG: NADH-quinone oxidoreductase subunit L [candidate division Zixibacteria bacterium]|nr:NADH-quinone oxidoreductase subunit L [candidate division Zixibacteria bacterium]